MSGFIDELDDRRRCGKICCEHDQSLVPFRYANFEGVPDFLMRVRFIQVQCSNGPTGTEGGLVIGIVTVAAVQVTYQIMVPQ